MNCNHFIVATDRTEFMVLYQPKGAIVERGQSGLVVRILLVLVLLTIGGVTSPANAQGDIITDILVGGEETKGTSKTEKTIENDSSPAEDSKISDRLNSIFSEIDELTAVQVSVSNSVVSLSGSAAEQSAVARAESLASQVEGVVEVVNSVTVNNDVSERVITTANRITATFQSIFVSLPMLILAFASTAAAWFLGRKLAAHATLFRHITPNAFIADLLGNICWIVITFLGVFIGLSLLNATSLIGTVLGAAGIFGLAIGFAVKDTVENYIASILLSLRHPFKTRDYVSIDGLEGSVARLTSRATILISSDGNHIRIPNSTVFKSSIINYTRNPQRRFQFLVGVDTEVDLGIAQQLARDTIVSVPGVLEEPAASIVIDELGDSNVSLIIRAWIDQRSHDITKVRSESIRLIKIAFDDAGIVMPEPIYRVLMSEAKHATKETTTPTTNASMSRIIPSSAPNQYEAQDTSTDTSVDATLEAEISSEDEDNLLNGSTQHE